MIKTFHEAPKQIFKQVQRVTSGDYALANLMMEDPEYFYMFEKAVEAGREVILDNGVFELGKSWDPDEYADCIWALQPTYYIVPDVLENCEATVHKFFQFINANKGLPGKVMGVIQGRNYDELVKCYKSIEPYCDKVGISFDYSLYQRGEEDSRHKWLNMMYGRRAVLNTMLQHGVINTNKPHHLLGVALPQEMQFYRDRSRWGWIDSVDTSNPVVHGLKGIRYQNYGLHDKDSQKLYTLVNSEVSTEQLGDIMYNISSFRRFCNG